MASRQDKSSERARREADSAADQLELKNERAKWEAERNEAKTKTVKWEAERNEAKDERNEAKAKAGKLEAKLAKLEAESDEMKAKLAADYAKLEAVIESDRHEYKDLLERRIAETQRNLAEAKKKIDVAEQNLNDINQQLNDINQQLNYFNKQITIATEMIASLTNHIIDSEKTYEQFAKLRLSHSGSSAQLEETPPTPSSAHLGYMVLEETKSKGLFKTQFTAQDDEIITGFPDLLETSSKLTESVYDRLMHPILSTCIPAGLVLVNSEAFPWIEVQGGRTTHRQKPDFFVCHPAMVERQTPDDDVCYGKLCNFGLRDGLGGIMDCKLQVTEKAVGELIIHLQHLCYKLEGTQRGVLFGKPDQPIYFVTMERGNVIEIIQTQWTAPGLRTFWKSFLTPTTGWACALTQLCTRLQLQCNIPTTTGSLFLGMGCYGRVFKVMKDDREMALKVLHAFPGESEFLTLQDIKAENGNVVTASDWTELDDDWAGYLIAEVGSRPSTRSRVDRQVIFETLLKLHQSGFIHGDCRLANIIMLRGEPLWIDFMDKQLSNRSKHNDLKTLIETVYKMKAEPGSIKYGTTIEGKVLDSVDDFWDDIKLYERRFQSVEA